MSVAKSNIPKLLELSSPITSSPVFWILKRVVPEEEAVRISWSVLVIFRFTSAFPDTAPVRSSLERGEVVPIPTFPVPFGIRARWLLEAVVIWARPFPEKAMFAPAPERVRASPVAETERLPVIAVLSRSEIFPVPELSTIFPVLASPRVKVFISIPAIVLAPVKVRFPANVAVGVPPAMLMNPNFAESVEIEPNKRSSVIKFGDKAPEFLCQKPRVPEVAQVCPLIQIVPVASGKVYVLLALSVARSSVPK